MSYRALLLSFIAALSADQVLAAPVIDVPASATPNPAEANVPVMLTVQGHDPDGDSVFFEWHIGGEILTGQTIEFTFTAPGVNTVTVVVADVFTNVAISAVDVVVGPETRITSQFGSAKGSLNLAHSAKDTITFTGTFTIPANIKTGSQVTVSFAGLQTIFNVNSKGIGTSPIGTAKFVSPKTPGGKTSFQIKITTPLKQYLDAAGVNTTIKKGSTSPVAVPLVISTNDLAAIMRPHIVLTAKGKTSIAITGS
ncbi:MAG TPA: PKD domain-containing protein [Planctomycetota bacterium]|jgi:hypothetical protein